MDRQTHDYTELGVIPKKYANGAVFMSKDTEIIKTENNTASLQQIDDDGTYRICAKKGEVIEVRVTNCSIDTNGDLCDVIMKTTAPMIYPQLYKTDFLGTRYKDNPTASGQEDFGRLELQVSKYKDSDLLLTWLSANCSSTHFKMTYVKAGTNTPANIEATVASVFDLDAWAWRENFDLSPMKGSEFATIDDAQGTIYYHKKENPYYTYGYNDYKLGYWLRSIEPDTKNGSVGGTYKYEWYSNVYEDNYGVGVTTMQNVAARKPPFVDENDWNIWNSGVFIEEFDDSTYKMAYGGYSGGICFTFASPYTFEFDAPSVVTDKASVQEEEKFTYSVKQYIPNNFYAKQFKLQPELEVSTDISIVNEIDKHLDIVGDITVTDETQKDVTSNFEISQKNNRVKATVKKDVFSDVKFYAHLYSVNIPVAFKRGSGQQIKQVVNSAQTIVDENTLQSNDVSVALKYHVYVNANINNGQIKINNQEYSDNCNISTGVDVGGSSNNTVSFKPDSGFNISNVLIDDVSVPLKDLSFENGVYSYTFTDTNITSNVNHTIVVDTEPKDTSVVVNYVDTAGKKLADSQTIPGKVFENYQTVEKTIYGYKLIETPANASGTMTEDIITVNYQYTLKDAQVRVKYIDNTNDEKLCDDIIVTGRVFDKYTTDSKSFTGYNLVTTPVNSSGEMTEDEIEVIYHYARKNTSVVANYINEQGQQIAESQIITGKYKEPYVTTQKNIYGYDFVRVEGNTSGTMAPDTIVVNYVYKLKDAKVVVNYINTDGETIEKTENIVGKVFDNYETQMKTIYGYSLTEVPANASGQMTEDTIIVNYVYKLKDASVIVKHINTAGEEISPSETITGKVFETYNTSPKTIYGYQLTTAPSNASGEMTENIITVIYVYELKNTKIIVNYINQSNDKIASSETLMGKVFDDYVSTAKDIYGYQLISTPDNASGKMSEETIVVNYIYKLKDAKVIVNYLNDSNAKIADSEVVSGKVFDDYSTQAINIYGYKIKDLPTNKTGKMTEETITVNYIYELKDTKVVSNYLNENNETIADSETIQGKVFENYNTQNKNIYGYELTSVPLNATGEMTENTIVVNYIYRLKNAKVIARYLDNQNKEIAESETIQGKVFDKYDTKSKNIYGYKLSGSPDNIKGTMTENIIYVDYIYDLKDSKVIVNHLDENNQKIADTEEFSGKVFDKYEVKPKEIYGYEVSKTPENASGTIKEETITVNYIYRLKNAKVIAKYLNESNNKIADTVEITGRVKDVYETAPKDIYGYSLIEMPVNASGVMTPEDITVNYMYRLKSATVITRYFDEEGKEIERQVEHNGQVFDHYETTPKDIYGYQLIKTPENASGSMSEDAIYVDYVYTLKDAQIIVACLDENEKEIGEATIITGKVFDEYKTQAAEIKGYRVVKTPENASGVMTEEPITVKYIYEKEPKPVVDTGDHISNIIIINFLVLVILFGIYLFMRKKYYN